MSDGQARAPDFALMRLVCAAEYDDLQPEPEREREDGLSAHRKTDKSSGLINPGGAAEEPNYSADTPSCQWIPAPEELCHRHTIGDKPGHFTGTGTRTGTSTRQPAEIRPASHNTKKVSVCSCRRGEDQSETSDAVLVLDGAKGQMGCDSDPCCREAAGRPPTPKHTCSTLQLSACGGGGSRATDRETDRETDRAPSRRGSLKVCFTKLFRTKSSGSTDSGHMTSRRPSLCSSTSCGGSVTDVFTSTDPHTTRSQMPRPHSVSFSPVPFTGETVSLVDVDISERSGKSLHPLQTPPPPPPPRRSLSLFDEFSVLQPGRLRTHTHIHHSLSLNDTTFCRVSSRPRPLQNNNQSGELLQPRSLLCPLTSSFTSSLRELEKCGWYWGPMNWEDAEMKLRGKTDGSFLVRDSSDPRYILSLSFRSQGVTHHTRMEHYRGTFSLWCHPKFEDRCHSVVEFIQRAILHSTNGRFLYFLRSRVPGLPPTPVQLLFPVSRFSSVKSLQHLCRFCIRQLVRIDHIEELPLPTPLIGYLRQFYFYDPEEEKNLSIRELGRDFSTQEAESQT